MTSKELKAKNCGFDYSFDLRKLLEQLKALMVKK